MTLICKMRWLSIAAVLGAAVLAGCGPKGAPSGTVSGTVALDGEPVDSGEISFVSSEGFAASGLIAGGEFKLGDSLPAGKYAIAVGPAALTEAPSAGDKDAVAPASPVPAGYHLSGTSGLSQEIQEGANSVKIELTKSGPSVGGAQQSAAP